MSLIKSIYSSRFLQLLFLVFGLPQLCSATHIVGGVLNYTHLGGSTYTIRLKLYRDCGAGTAAFPSNIIISVRGNNGATFSPSKDITMSLAGVTSVPGNTLPCAVNPNPMPCVQEGTYSLTVSNLPASTSGYHLYYQVSARNLSLNNINNACNCIGETYYAYIPGSSKNAVCNCTITNNSNPSFNLLPPLFLCVNQAFVFNHSATDADGDSLVYSMYTPYNGDNGTGPLDPTYSGNVANFTPVNFLSGYTATNPLGTSSPFFLNSTTGVITATPTQIGQFVVGIKVQEYRNGVFISETLRDVQFNVLNCPSPPPGLSISDFSMSANCTKTLAAGGISPASASWNSIAPGSTGQYNSYLSCVSGCATPSISAPANPPSYIDYKICGTSTNCAGTSVCDTFRIYFISPLSASIIPVQPVICNGQTSATLSASASGGAAPYNFLWNNVNPSQSINVGAGTYNLKVTDATGCQPVYQSVQVNSYTIPITVDAGNNQTVCVNNPLAALNGSVNGAGGGIWSGGTGTFSPSNLQLSNVYYTPSASELNTGFTKLFLTSTGNGGCQSKTDSILIFYSNFTGTVTTNLSQPLCYGMSNGAATVSIAGGYPPFVYSWNNGATTNQTNNLSAGFYSVTITDAIGCIHQHSVQLSQPLPLAVSQTVSPLLCAGANNASITANATGGTLPYTFTWFSNAGTIPSGNNLAQGNYTLVITDANTCTNSASFNLTAPAPLSITSSITPVTCFGFSTGIITTQALGGLGPYTYNWNSGNGSSNQISGLAAGNYSLVITDANNCSSSFTLALAQPNPLSIAVSSTNESCPHLNNGLASANISGGNGNYLVQWQPNNVTGFTVSNLASGVYTVSCNDAKNCSTTSLVTISEPLPVSVTVQNIKHVSCYGVNDASVVTQISGGTGPYTYTWLPSGGNQAQISFLGPGTITLNVADGNACAASMTVTVTEPASLTSVFSKTDVTCFGGSNGTTQMSSTGGTAPYAYQWSNSGIVSAYNNQLMAGVVTVTTTDINNCKQTTTLIINEPAQLTPIFSITPVSCNSFSNAVITASATGGTLPYSYYWLPNNLTGPQLTNLPAGNYTLTITDNNGCSSNTTIAVTEPQPLVAVTSVTNESCNYNDDGSARVLVSGGTAPYAYFWNTVSAANFSNHIAAGSYSVDVLDANSCSTTVTYTVQEPAALSINLSASADVSCNGLSDGFLSVSVLGGTAPYFYNWNNGLASTAALSGLAAANYTVIVTDINSCTLSASYTVSEPLPLSLNSNITTITCSGNNNGAVSVITTGGTAPYVHTILPGAISGTNFSNLSPGIYTVTTLDANSCPASITVAINQPISLTAVTNATPSSCLNNDGIATVSVTSGGTAPFTYTWLPYGGNANVATNLSAGSYTIIINDATGCSSSRIVNISDVASAVVSVLNATHVSCYGGNNGALTASISGGTGPAFTYSWAPSGGSGNTANGLSAGTYFLKVTDSNGCIGLSSTSVVTQPSSITAVISSNSVLCKGGNSGSATITAFGGTGTYSYTWLSPTSSASSITNLSAGIYSVQVTDGNLCSQQFSILINEPANAVTLSVSASAVTCFGSSNGTIACLAQGGYAPYNYSISTLGVVPAIATGLSAGNYTCFVADKNNCVSTASIVVNQPAVLTQTIITSPSNCGYANASATTGISGGTAPYTVNWFPANQNGLTAANLLAGNYSVSVVDNNGCSISNSFVVNDNPAPSVTAVVISTISCFNGTNGELTAAVNGGSAPYTYLWMPSAQSLQTATALPSASYSVLVTAANSCTTMSSAVFVPQAPAMWQSYFTTSVSCFGGTTGSATITTGGGTAPYSYNWSPIAASGPIAANLPAGNYTISITDANNCAQVQTLSINQPTAGLSINFIDVKHVSCFGELSGSITVQASGGTSPYAYSWIQNSGNSPVITNLGAGVYSVQVTDFNNCVTGASTLVTQALAPLSVTATGAAVRCYGETNGSVSANAAGGTAPYSYTWNTGPSNTSSLTNLGAGTYTVLVTDSNNCKTATSVVVQQPAALTASVLCFVTTCGKANGSIYAQVSGGTSGYTYNWQPGAQTSSFCINQQTGNYTLTVTDLNSCTALSTASLSARATPSITSISQKNVGCYGSATGSLSLQTNGGHAPFQYVWLPYGSTSYSANALMAGNYTIVVTDADGCRDSIAKTISQPAELQLQVSNKSDVRCYNESSGKATILAFGGSPGYTYNWSNGNTSAQSTSLNAGTYTVTVTDQQFCQQYTTFSINQPQQFSLTVSTIQHPLCYNGWGSATVAPSGGTAPYSYNWNSTPPQQLSTANLLPPGAYTVTSFDNNNCFASTYVYLQQPSPVVTSVTKSDTICKGAAANLKAQANGGSGNYTYAWATDGVITSGTYTPSPAANSSYTVVAFDDNGCAGNEAITKVVVFSLSKNNISLSAVSPICPGGKSFIGATITGNTGNVSFAWSNSLAPTAGPLLVSPNKTTTYFVSVSGECGSTFKDSIVVQVNKLPVPSFVSDTTQACTEGVVNFTDLSVPGESDDPIISWNWDFGDGEATGIQHPEHLFVKPGKYVPKLSITTDRGCTASKTASFEIEALKPPSASFSFTSQFYNLPVQAVTCINTSTDAVAYNWFFNDGGFSNSTNAEYRPTMVGPISVTLIAISKRGCKDTATDEINTGSGLQFPTAFTPNPLLSSGGYYDMSSLTNDVFFPYSTGVISYHIQIFDRWGELIFESSNIEIGWDGYYKGKLCQEGVYFYTASAKLNDGSDFNQKGDISLLR